MTKKQLDLFGNVVPSEKNKHIPEKEKKKLNNLVQEAMSTLEMTHIDTERYNIIIDMFDAIKGTNILKEWFDKLLAIFDKLPCTNTSDEYTYSERTTVFFDLIEATNKKLIKVKFFDLLRVIDRIQDEKEKGELFEYLIEKIHGTTFLKRNFFKVLSFIKWENINIQKAVFSSLLKDNKLFSSNNFIEVNFSPLLTTLRKMDREFQRFAFYSLFELTKGTHFFHDKFNEFLKWWCGEKLGDYDNLLHLVRPDRKRKRKRKDQDKLSLFF